MHTSDGRMDAVVQTDCHIYILEFKFNQTAQVALDQIRDKNYAARYKDEHRTIVAIGLNFSSQIRAINDILIANG